MNLTIGRIVHYRLTETEATAINRRRASPTAYNHGNEVRAGDTVALTVTREGKAIPPPPGSEDAKLLAGEAGPGGAYAAGDPVYEINGQATLDGNDHALGDVRDRPGRRSRQLELAAAAALGRAAVQVAAKEDPTDVDGAFSNELSPDVGGIRQKLQDILDADPRLLFEANGKYKPFNDWPDREARAILQFSYNEKTGHGNVKFADQIKAAENIARLDGLYAQDPDKKTPFEKLLDIVPRAELHTIMTKLSALGATQAQAAAATQANGASPPKPPEAAPPEPEIVPVTPILPAAGIKADTDLDVI